MTSSPYWFLVQPPAKWEGGRNHRSEERGRALGVMKGKIFVDGDDGFLKLLNRPAYPVSLEEVFGPDQTAALLEIFRGSEVRVYSFEIEREQARYLVSV